MSDAAPPAVAFLGLGRMGTLMARRVAQAGFPLAVWNRSARPEAVPEGAQLAATPRDAAGGATIVVTMVADAAALTAVIDGSDGALAGAREGAVLVDMSTIGPQAARAAAWRCRGARVAFLDAPVSGSTLAARSDQLVAMVGGDPATLERARPVLGAMTRDQLWLGATGAGAAMKMALNLAVAITNQTVAEVLTLAKRSGIAPSRPTTGSPPARWPRHTSTTSARPSSNPMARRSRSRST